MKTDKMKYIFILWWVIGVQTVGAQDNRLIMSLEDFKELKGFDGLSINLIKATENKAVITGDNVDKVVIVNNDGVLKIRMQIRKIFSGYKTFVDIYYKSKLVIIDVNEDALIRSEDEITQDILELKAQEGGEIRIKAAVEQMMVKSITGGVIKAVGFARLQDVKINTGGVYEGKEFKTKFTTINVNAGSRAEAYASDYVKVSVKAGGEVLLYGNPAKVDERKVFGGIIKRM